MTITLVRHIKTSAPEGICYGQTDVTLPNNFKTTHQQLTKQLSHLTFDAIYASPLQRCALLAKEAAGNQPITFDNRLKELNFGDWENKRWKDIEKLPEAKQFFNDFVNITPPNGESFKQMIDRIVNFLEDLKNNKSYKNILIVTHGGPIRIFHGLTEGLDVNEYFKREVDFGEISTLKI